MEMKGEYNGQKRWRKIGCCHRPRNEQIGILKNMLYRAYNLCDPGEERQEEIDLLKYAFINQNFPPKEVIKTIQSYDEHDGIVENNERAKERTESIVVLYIKGVSEKLRKELAKEDVNLVFKKGRTLHSMIFNGKYKKSDVMGETNTLSTKSLARIANYAILEKQRNGMMNGKSSIRDVLGIKMTTTHYSGTSRRQDIILLGNE